ncbi:PKD domain-containing protein [Tamlana sp. 2201CG12-4]|uniref:PKD domain-containing protein n=1 Tax=Tamlana sp. 2201CG12-4 TaxID=3112582 RepID=UPI002DBC97D1|nr:PKD domain-containing protein [Tamlana sp. 2201CG12-4]MEC3908322.1 PKD domain-containing protein [Tamlana sp. 2201CG12-4]
MLLKGLLSFKTKKQLCRVIFFFSFATTLFSHAITPPEVGPDGVLSFTSESGVTDIVVVTINGSNYDVSITSDGIESNHSYPISSVVQFRYMNMEMGVDMLNTSAAPNLYREMSHHDEYAPKVSEMADMFDLVRYKYIIVKSVANGDWSSGSTWDTGTVPEAGARVLINKGHVVTVDSEIANAVRTVRIDGGLKFSTTQNSSLKVDTMVGMMGSTFEMGSTSNPIPEGITAKLIIENIGDFVNSNENDPDYDPSHLGLGVILHGSTKIHGMKRTGYATFKEALIGNHYIKLDQTPLDWKVGDKIAIAGTTRDGKGDEARIITGIGGNTVSFQRPLEKNHVIPNHTKVGLELKLHVINLTRNAIITTQEGSFRYEMDGSELKSRGHIMFMHTNNVDIHYAGFYELGRTNKLGSMVNMKRDATTGAVTRLAHNPIARYPCHFHRTGADGTSFGVVEGSAVDGSPGWGFVNHRGAAYINNNVAYNVNGASFIAEVGNEIGTFYNNISIRTLGDGKENNTAEPNFGAGQNYLSNGNQVFENNINEFGSAGDGFWFHSHTVHFKDNVASGFTGNGFNFWNQALDGVDRDPTKASNNETNEDFGSGTGLLMQKNQAYGGNIAFSQNFGSQASGSGGRGFHRIEDFVGYQVNTGIRRKYTKHTEYRRLVLIGDLEDPIGNAAYDTHENGRSQQFIDAHVEGFIRGFKAEKRQYTHIIKGGYFNNVFNITLGFRHDRDQSNYYINNTFGDLSEEALNKVKGKLPGFDGIQIDYLGLNDVRGGDVVSEEDESAGDGSNTEGKPSDMVVSHDGENYKVFLKTEQHPDSIPPVDLVANSNKTNRQRFLEGKVSSVFSAEFYDPEIVFEPSLPNVNYNNIVLGPVEHVNNAKGEPVRDVIIKRPEDVTVAIDHGGIEFLSSNIFERVLDNNTPVISVVENSDTNIVSTVTSPDKSKVTITPLALGTSTIIFQTDTEGEVTFDVTVVPSVPLPIAVGDAFDIEFDEAISLDVLKNDTGENAINGFEITIVSQPSNGSLFINSDNTIAYTPNTGASGPDSFSYTITDSVEKTSTPATVTLNVISEAPDYTVTVLEGETITIDVARTIASNTPATYGSVSFNNTVLTYVQNGTGHSGTDAFTYDVNGQTGTITILIDNLTTITNTPPVVNAGEPIVVIDRDDTNAEPVTLDGSLSYDLEGSITSYHWDVNGLSSSAISPTFNLPVGTYTASLTCTDNEGKSSLSFVDVTVQPNPGIFFKKKIISDSDNRATQSSKEALDGDTDTRWQSKKSVDLVEDTQNIVINMERFYNIESITFNLGTYAKGRIREFKVHTSVDLDKNIWKEVAHFGDGISALSQFQTVNFSTPEKVLFVRFEGIGWAETDDFRIFEVTGSGVQLANELPVANAGIDLIVYDQDDSGIEDGMATLNLDGSQSEDPDLRELTYVWEDTMGNTYYGINPEITLPLGTHNFVLTVTDLDGATATDNLKVEVVSGEKNIALYKDVITSGGTPGSSDTNFNDGIDSTIYNNAGTLPQFVGVDLGQVFALDRVEIEWDTDYGVDYSIQKSNDGINWTNVKTITSNSEVSNTIDLSGMLARYVRVSVTNSIGASFGIKEFEVYKVLTTSQIPIAKAGLDFTVSDLNKNGFETITLNGSLSSDNDGTIMKYAWSIPGYATQEGIETTLNVPLGTTTITLTVTDNDGNTATDSIDVTVVDDNVNIAIKNMLLYDFESGVLDDSINNLRTTTFAIVDNPDVDLINPSTKVLKVDLEGDADNGGNRELKWVGIEMSFNGGLFKPNLRYLHVKMRASYVAPNSVRVSNGSQANYNSDLETNAAADTWEDVVFDLKSDTWDAQKLILRLEEVSAPWDAEIVYLDDIYLSNDPSPYNGVTNIAPIAMTSDYIATDNDGNGMETLSLDGSSSTDSDSTILGYKWLISGLGQYSSAAPVFDVDISVGVYNGTLVVTDINGAEGTTTFTITVNPDPNNVNPIANAGVDQYIATATGIANISLDGALSTDPDGVVVGYIWDIPNVGILNGVYVNADLPLGATTVDLTVIDDKGARHTDSVVITVLDENNLPATNIHPIANAGGHIIREDTDGSGFEEVALDGSASYDVDGTIMSYSWDIPGVPGSPFTGITPTVTLPKGSYNATITVTDNLGLTSSSQFNIIVESTLGVNEVDDSSKDYMLYPNPANEKVFIRHLKEEKEITIYSILGELIMNTKISDGESVNVSNLNSGVYVLKINNGNNTVIKRFIKE